MMYGLYNGYGYCNGMDGFGGSFGGTIMMVFFWVFLMGLIIWVIREIRTSHNKSNSHALDILNERYAKGEINRKEFEEMKKDIK